MSNETPLLEVSGLAIAYRTKSGSTLAVRNVDLALHAGETVAVVGESGSGKTTVAHALIGLLPRNGTITGGSIHVDGDELTHAKDRTWRNVRGGSVGLVPQDPMVSLNPTQRIGTQISEAITRHIALPKPAVAVRVIEALTQAGITDPVLRARQYPHELSGGLRQRVLIAIALAARPRAIIADEPTSALDVTVQKTILDHLEGLVAEHGIGLLIITHDLAIAADRADRIIVMQYGEIVESGTPAQILENPSHPYTKRLIAAAPVALGDNYSVGGRAQTRKILVADDEPGLPLLQVHGLTKDFALPRTADGPSTFRAVDDVNFTVNRGQTLGLVGESGSGKSTTLRLALGLEHPTAGQILFDGQDLGELSWRQLRPMRRRFQLVQQNPFASVDPRFSILDAITEPLVAFRIGNRASRKAAAEDLLDRVALPREILGRKARELSGGQLQRVAIARALTLKPDLLFLDEPVSALDVSVQGQILTLLADLKADLKLAYVLVSHDLAVVGQIADQVAVLNRGKLVEYGAAEQVFTNPQSEYTQELLSSIPGRRRATSPALITAPATTNFEGQSLS